MYQETYSEIYATQTPTQVALTQAAALFAQAGSLLMKAAQSLVIAAQQ